MSRIMESQGHAEPVGQAKISAGFNLPVKHIIHTVGPSIAHTKQAPSEREREQLASCYRSCLDAAATLQPGENGTLSIAFCCISTGLFAFPKPLAASIAINTVLTWCETHPSTPITDIAFDVWTEEDLALYTNVFDSLDAPPPPTATSLTSHHVAPQTLLKAKQWIKNADALLLTAGAGLSAAAGLDYTSTTLFKNHYPAYAPLGLTRLYDTIGFSAWPSELTKWGYYFLQADLVRRWPSSPIYLSLLDLVSKFGEDKWWVKTSNADGLFASHGFPAGRISTPQGQYAYLQCLARCRPNAVFRTAKYLDAALPFIDPKTQSLTDPALVPKCEFCGGEMTLCVRGGGYFNSSKFEGQEDAYHDFVDDIIDSGKNLVILELGVGMNTAGVLRWPNEELVERGDGRINLVRMGLGPSACAPLEMVEDGHVVVVDGDLGAGVDLLTA